MNVAKNDALRQALTKKKSKGEASQGLKKLLSDFIDDSTEEKMTGHLLMKAHALRSKTAFNGFTKAELSFLYLSYGIAFKKSFKKRQLSEDLQEKISIMEKIPHQEVVTRGNLENTIRLFNEGKVICLASLGIVVNEERSTNENPVNDTMLEAQNVENVELRGESSNENASAPRTNAEPPRLQRAQKRPRLRPFKATKSQEDILRSDNQSHEGKVPKNLERQRVIEFGIDVTQVRRWHLNFNKK